MDEIFSRITTLDKYLQAPKRQRISSPEAQRKCREVTDKPSTSGASTMVRPKDDLVTIPTSNRFAVLETDDTTPDSLESQASGNYDSNQVAMDGVLPVTVTPLKKVHTPPIVVYGFERYRDLVAVVKSVVADHGFTIASRVDSFAIKVKSIDDFRALSDALRDRKVQFHTYPTGEVKTRRFVLRGLSARQSADDVRNDLIDGGYAVRTVTQMTGPGPQHVPIPLFVVTTLVSPDAPSLVDLRVLGHSRVTVEPYKGAKGPTMCFNCQRFNHTSTFCNVGPRCFKCAEGHSGRDCKKSPLVPAKCVNCGGDHPASYRKCPAYLRAASQHLKPTIPRERPTARPLPATKARPGHSYSAAVCPVLTVQQSPSEGRTMIQLPTQTDPRPSRAARSPPQPLTESPPPMSSATYGMILDICKALASMTTDPIISMMVTTIASLVEGRFNGP